MLDELNAISADLSENEKAILEELGRVQAAVPAELAVKTYLLPEELYPLLDRLQEKRLIETRQTGNSMPGELITLSDRGLHFWKLTRTSRETR